MNRITPDQIRNLYLTNDSKNYGSIFNPGGGGMPHFAGIHVQDGQGLIDVFKTIGLQALKRAGPHILTGISKLTKDIKRGKNVKKSLKRRGIRALKQSAKSALGSGRKRKILKKGKRSRRKQKYNIKRRKTAVQKRKTSRRRVKKIPKSFALLS